VQLKAFIKFKIMNLQPHNPNYKLVGVIINNKEFVFGVDNNGNNEGLEVYYKKSNDPAQHFYYSRRFTGPRNIPMVYNELFIKLKKMVAECLPGYKLTLELTDFKNISF
jgi:hypothetical protein